MRRLLTRTFLATVAAAAAVILPTSSASAATFTVTEESGDNQLTTFSQNVTVSTPRVTLRCQDSQGHGINLRNGDQSGVPIAQIDSLNFNNCIIGGLINFTVRSNAAGGPPGGPWDINALSESPTDQVNFEIKPQPGGTISAHIHGTNVFCEVDVIGTTVPGHYQNPTNDVGGRGVIPGDGQDLTTQNVQGCNGLIDNGGPFSIQADYFFDFPDDLVEIHQTG